MGMENQNGRVEWLSSMGSTDHWGADHMSQSAKQDQFVGIGLTFEPVDGDFIAKEDITDLAIYGVYADYEMQGAGEPQKSHHCQTVRMQFRYYGDDGKGTHGGISQRLFGRLHDAPDVTSITLCYESGKEVEIRVPWDFRSDYSNGNMVVYWDQEEHAGTMVITDDQNQLRDALDAKRWTEEHED